MDTHRLHVGLDLAVVTLVAMATEAAVGAGAVEAGTPLGAGRGDALVHVKLAHGPWPVKQQIFPHIMGAQRFLSLSLLGTTETEIDTCSSSSDRNVR